MGFPVAQPHDGDPAQTVDAFEQHSVTREQIDALELDILPMRDEFNPVLASRRRNRCSDEPEVERLVVGDNEQPVGVMIHRVLDPLPARLDD